MIRTTTLTAIAFLLALSACAAPPEVAGKRLFNDHCIACHGQTGRGDGPISDQVGQVVPDLTLISERNGGTFPMAEVMSTIDGYTRVRAGNTVMPEFGIDLQAGPLVLVDTGDGIETPTPSRLVALAEYLRSLQR